MTAPPPDKPLAEEPTRRRKTGVVPASQRSSRRGPPRCEGCGEQLVWAVTERGGRMPVNVNQDITGNLVLCYEVDALERAVSGQLVMPAPTGYEGPRWLSHFATCPKASAYRRGRAERGEL